VRYLEHAIVLEGDGSRSAVFNDYSRNVGARKHSQIWPFESGRQISVYRTATYAIFLRHLVESGALLRDAIKVWIAGNAYFVCRSQKSARQWIHASRIGYVNRPAHAMKFGTPALLGL
jgi:hypothetical protein